MDLTKGLAEGISRALGADLGEFRHLRRIYEGLADIPAPDDDVAQNQAADENQVELGEKGPVDQPATLRNNQL